MQKFVHLFSWIQFVRLVAVAILIKLEHLLQWSAAIESLDYDSGSDKSFGMKQRPDGDIEIDEKFWEEDFNIPTCPKCDGVLKPDVRYLPFFYDIF